MIVPQTEIIATRDGEEVFRATFPPGEYVIGREAGMPIRLHSDKVSRRHGQITLSYYDWLIEDFGSANGSFVSERPISQATLIFPQQEVRVGNVRLELRRLPAPIVDEDALAPQTAAVRRYVPVALRGDRKYKVHGVIAMGGMGAVLEAEDTVTRRRVAMKVLLEIRSEEDVARFVEEAQITAQLDHPNIVPLYELNVNELDKPFYTMKLVRGDSLKTVISGLKRDRPAMRERYTLEELLAIFQRIADAIAFAHSKGVVHRDLKPDNIMLGAFGETVVMDWGLAKPMGRKVSNNQLKGTMRTMISSTRQDTAAHFTQVGTALGTPQYMSPEQASGNSYAVDARADVYGLGALLYSVLTLQPPIEAGDPEEVLSRVVAGRIAPPEEVVRSQPPVHLPDGKLPAELSAIVMKALALDPDARYPNVREFQAALQEWRPGGWLAARFGLDGLFKAKTAKPGR